MKSLLTTAALALMLSAPAFAETMVLTAEDFAALDAAKTNGAMVVGTEGEELGTVDETIRNTEGLIEQVVFTVGGDTPRKVAVPITELKILQDGDDVSVEYDSTPEEINELPSHE